MSSPVSNYLKDIANTYSGGKSTEHSFRGDLQKFLEELLPGVHITNEPQRHRDCGAPDYFLQHKKIPLGYIEAKNLGKSLDSPVYKEQLSRYRKGLGNLIFTNYLDFRLYHNGKQVFEISVAELSGTQIKSKPENFEGFLALINEFADYQGQTISKASHLAEHMANRALLLAKVIADALAMDEKNKDETGQKDSELQNQLKVFRRVLITDIQPAEFADIYAQTIAYGMFAARLHDQTLADFSRHEAANLIPKSNPFLRKFFQYIAGNDLDDRVQRIVDNLADIFRATNVAELMKDFGKATQRKDPFIHFYETFLGKYNKKLRKRRGVYYTPEPIVSFIVRAVDEVLKSEFNLPDGIADTAKTSIEMHGTQKEIHKVQILDPAVGTGTFLAEVVKQIYRKFAAQKGVWPAYVEKDLIPRLNGFEILMAPYAMAHLKLEMILRETGCELGGERLRIFLTNSLEEHHLGMETQLALWLSDESKEANEIKRDVPVMVVMGNPPYSISSSNTGEWIEAQMNCYKRDLSELNIQPLSDDYLKFIRYGQLLVERTGEGVLAYISNNGFISGLIHRKMREHLLGVFDKIYILDLHGSTKTKETTPDGLLDKNVFDIQQGVSINLFIKTGEKEKDTLGEVFHYDLFGGRDTKYEFLWSHGLNEVKFQKLQSLPPNFFFVPKDFSAHTDYEDGFSIPAVFSEYNSGVKTGCDSLSVKFSQKEIEMIANDFLSLDVAQLKEKYLSKKETNSWNFAFAKSDLMRGKFQFEDMLYRPFDIRRTIYTKKSGFIGRSRHKIMKHLLAGQNFALVIGRQGQVVGEGQWNLCFIAQELIDTNIFYRGGGIVFPLYFYPDKEQNNFDYETERKPNLNIEIIKEIADRVNMKFTAEKTNARNTFAPIDLLDYIYAILYSPAYREKFQEFLKIDFPRVPFPRDTKQFRTLARLGTKLRALHLMESEKLNTLITTYPETGDNTVTAIRFDTGKVWINKAQHFAKVPKAAWEFYIGGYQPAKKWLKDRKDRTLTWDEIKHYQKIIVALVETRKIMGKIDKAL